jgi:hypothetical protein
MDGDRDILLEDEVLVGEHVNVEDMALCSVGAL